MSSRIPVPAGDPVKEHLHVRSGLGLIDLHFQNIIEVTGSDRVRFLNGMVSNDIKSLQPGSGVYAALLTPHGKMIADMNVYALQEAHRICLYGPPKDKVLETLNRYVIADQVEIRDLDDEIGTLSIQGARAGPFVDSIFGPTISTAMEPLQHMQASLNQIPCWTIKVSHTGDEGYDLVVAKKSLDQAWQFLLEKGEAYDLRPIGMAALNTLRLEAGIPLYGLDMDESQLLLEAGLEHAISWTKGCYVGQETIARINYRGHVNKRMVGIKIQGDMIPQSKDKILKEGKQVGIVTSAAFSPSLKRVIALAYVHRDFNQPGNQVIVEIQNQLVSAEVVPLPFYNKLRGS